MKSKLISVLILSISLFLVSCTFWYSFGLSKPKPDPKRNPELITFVGDLYGNQTVEGCCPNAGPFPKYTMTLSQAFDEVIPETMIGVELDGNIFMNVYMDLSLKGHGNKKAYVVKFWWPEDAYYFIDIRGGDIDENKQTKILTVTFVNEPCKIWINDIPTDSVTVSFTLTRSSYT